MVVDLYKVDTICRDVVHSFRFWIEKNLIDQDLIRLYLIGNEKGMADYCGLSGAVCNRGKSYRIIQTRREYIFIMKHNASGIDNFYPCWLAYSIIQSVFVR